ncbi:hypothetical protein DID76_02135 [Candidatus Marinamargulisbacteria bacterium SCGC AG-414-C22]|nr:hypothetical protein DID76_02135 [Candidatus Marinamargulisbacteria bacterium SCGC AG-414-C22]
MAGRVGVVAKRALRCCPEPKGRCGGDQCPLVNKAKVLSKKPSPAEVNKFRSQFSSNGSSKPANTQVVAGGNGAQSSVGSVSLVPANGVYNSMGSVLHEIFSKNDAAVGMKCSEKPVFVPGPDERLSCVSDDGGESNSDKVFRSSPLVVSDLNFASLAEKSEWELYLSDLRERLLDVLTNFATLESVKESCLALFDKHVDTFNGGGEKISSSFLLETLDNIRLDISGYLCRKYNVFPALLPVTLTQALVSPLVVPLLFNGVQVVDDVNNLFLKDVTFIKLFEELHEIAYTVKERLGEDHEAYQALNDFGEICLFNGKGKLNIDRVVEAYKAHKNLFLPMRLEKCKMTLKSQILGLELSESARKKVENSFTNAKDISKLKRALMGAKLFVKGEDKVKLTMVLNSSDGLWAKFQIEYNRLVKS